MSYLLNIFKFEIKIIYILIHLLIKIINNQYFFILFFFYYIYAV